MKRSSYAADASDANEDKPEQQVAKLDVADAVPIKHEHHATDLDTPVSQQQEQQLLGQQQQQQQKQQKQQLHELQLQQQQLHEQQQAGSIEVRMTEAEAETDPLQHQHPQGLYPPSQPSTCEPSAMPGTLSHQSERPQQPGMPQQAFPSYNSAAATAAGVSGALPEASAAAAVDGSGVAGAAHSVDNGCGLENGVLTSSNQPFMQSGLHEAADQASDTVKGANGQHPQANDNVRGIDPERLRGDKAKAGIVSTKHAPELKNEDIHEATALGFEDKDTHMGPVDMVNPDNGYVSHGVSSEAEDAGMNGAEQASKQHIPHRQTSPAHHANNLELGKPPCYARPCLWGCSAFNSNRCELHGCCM